MLAAAAASGKKSNAASGGTESTITILGVPYRLHTFSSGSTLVVTASVVPFDVLVVAGGANGGVGWGGNGGEVKNQTLTIPIGSHTITVGGAAQNSAIGALLTAVQGAGAAGGWGSSGPGANGTQSSITGTSTYYAGAGGGGAPGDPENDGPNNGSLGGLGGGGHGGIGAREDSTPNFWEQMYGYPATFYGGGGGAAGGGVADTPNGVPGGGYGGLVIVRYPIG